jgi:hypothetical protein
MFYYDEEICRKCGGACCKRMPGCAIPDDIAKLFPAETIQESVKKALLSKKWSIDWWEGDTPVYFLRPVAIAPKFLVEIETKKSKIFDASWGGKCIYLEEFGCILPRDSRPDQCKRFKPIMKKEGVFECDIVDNQFIKLGGKLYYANLWKKRGIDLHSIGQEVLKILNNT